MSTHLPDPSTFSLLTIPHEGTDWPLWMTHDSEPTIRDLDWAQRLGYERPRSIRDLIKRMAESGQLGQVFCRTVRQNSASDGTGRGRPSLEYFLTEAQALKVAARSETKAADKILDQIIAVCMKARAGVFRPASDPLMPELIAELRAGREERKVTMGILLQLTERLLQPQARPEPMTLTSVQAQAAAWAAAAEPRADYFVTAVKLGAELGLKRSAIYRFFQAHPDLRKMQRADGRWPLHATMEEVRRRRQQPAARTAQAAKPRKARSTHQLAERAAVVFHMRTYCKANDLTQDQAAAAWHKIYDAFTKWAGYDPRKLKAPGQRPLDVVAEREHMEHFLLIVKEVCPLVDKAEGATA